MWPLIAAAAAQGTNSAMSQLTDIGMGLGGMFANINQAGISRDDQRYYTENAHSVEVEDLKRAGLNPILSANKGAAVPTPVTSQPGQLMADAGANAASRMNGLVGMLKELAIGAAQVDNINADTSLKAGQAGRIPAEVQSLIASADNSRSQAYLNQLYGGKVPYEVEKLIADKGAANALASLYGAQKGLVGAQTGEARSRTALNTQELGYRSESNPLALVQAKIMNRLREAEISSVQSSARERDSSAAVNWQKYKFGEARGGYEGWRGDVKNWGTRLENTFNEAMKGLLENPGPPSHGQSSASQW